MKHYPCPSTGLPTGACPGYVIAYIRPLKQGGKDIADNMQWTNKPQPPTKEAKLAVK